MTTQNRQPVLRCVLSNAAHPEYGQVTIPFPIPGMEYERTLECLAAMELGAPLKRDCRVDELESGFPILKRLEKVGANLDELDYLARRLDSLITDFSDLDAVGRQHYMTLEGGCASEEELEQVDGRAAALKLILNKHGTITPYGVVYDNGMELEKFYKEGGPFPDYLDREFVILLEASYGEGQSTLLVLPDSPERLERLLCRTGIRDSPHFWIVDSTLPGEVISSIPAERLSINGLNRLCQAVERIAPEDLKTLVQLLADKDHPSQGPSLGGLSM